ncbi:hypothetical protein EVAR_66661_1 [Eumeta japonica]|uniref:Uncharacterized protein n=1 Tax=Eumeta variegata TaxID=151549 RepID=A0A4C1Z7I5_EUMVA|nr:hypothetical protein EVAR_66661_1 [Eumeta japonica]
MRLIRATAHMLQMIDIFKPAHIESVNYKRTARRREKDLEWNRNSKKKKTPAPLRYCLPTTRVRPLEAEYMKRVIFEKQTSTPATRTGGHRPPMATYNPGGITGALPASSIERK